MRSMYWQLGILGTISAFAFRYKEIQKKPVYLVPLPVSYETYFMQRLLTNLVTWI